MRTAIPLSILCLAAAALSAQTSQSPPVPQNAAPTLAVTSRLVVVDVVVRDGNKPVRDLEKTDFTLLENGRPQTIAVFEPHIEAETPGTSNAPAPAPPTLPPDTFTNLPIAHVTGSVTVLLLDALNTPADNQLTVRREMIRYLKNLPPGRRIAVFTLGTHLELLQGFTANSGLLLAALASKAATPQASMLPPPDQATDQRNLLDNMAEAHLGAQTIDNAANFMNESNAAEAGQRVSLTLDAMQQLARYLNGIPGRKNLVWFSGSFPLSFYSTQKNPFHQDEEAALQRFSESVQDTADLLADARVAVYPVDARGVLALPMYSATQQGDYARVVNGNSVGGQRMLQDTAAFDIQTSAEHNSMDLLAGATGGRAVYGSNDLKEALADALSDGSTFYTLAYVPTDHNFNGKLRHIDVRVDRPQDRLFYRRAYYADNRSASQSHGSAGAHGVFLDAMQRGAPPSTQIVFEARVVPVALQPVTAAIFGHGSKLKDPSIRYAIDYAIDPRALTLHLASGGIRKGQIVYAAAAWNRDGKSLNSAGVTQTLELSPANWDFCLRNGLQLHQTLDLPAGRDLDLRLGLYDVSSGNIGTLEIPLHITPPKSESVAK